MLNRNFHVLGRTFPRCTWFHPQSAVIRAFPTAVKIMPFCSSDELIHSFLRTYLVTIVLLSSRGLVGPLL